MAHARNDSADDLAAPEFSAAFREQLDDLIRWRRDVRRFRPDPVPTVATEAIYKALASAPSVGLSQPWRVVNVRSNAARARILANFQTANANALGDLSGERAQLYASLKLEGLEMAPEQLAVFCDPNPEQGGSLGRRTMPEMVHASTICAVMQMWLVARAWGVGVGWVSILSPEQVKRDLDVPGEWDFVAYLCIGLPAERSAQPELERAGWEVRSSTLEIIER